MQKQPPILVKFIAGALIFAGLPLLGWGLFDLPGFFANPARLAYILLAIAQQAVVLWLDPQSGRIGGAGVKLVARQRLAVALLQVITLSVVIAAPLSDRLGIAVLPFDDILRFVGLALFVSGFSLMSWAEAALGRQFSIQVTLQAGHQLVTSGPYRWLRHPRYSGILLYNLGVALVFHSGLTLIFWLALAVVLMWRIHDEEDLLAQEFGSGWQAYKRKTWRLAPFIY